MTHGPIVGDFQAGPDRPVAPGGAPVASVVLLALVAQVAAPAIARSADGADGIANVAAADTSAQAVAGSVPAPPSREDRYWADLVRACSANAKHVRLYLPGRTVETDHVEPDAAGIRFRSPHLAARSRAISEEVADADTLVAWNAISKVEVRNVSSTGEAAGTGAVVGFGIGAVGALVAATAAAFGSFFTFQKQDSHAAGYVLGGTALGLLIGAAAPHHPNGGWATCCERDSSAATSGAESLH